MNRPGWRMAGLGLAFLGLFGVLFFRLWFLQLAMGVTYQDRAERQQVRLVATPAPRGEIRDRRGELLAGSRASLSVRLDSKLLPAEQQESVISGLAALLHRAPVELQARIEEEAVRDSGSPLTLASDVPQEIALYLFEHAQDFPGVVVEPVPVRTYPRDALAAHVLGYLGRPSEEDLGSRPGLRPDEEVGQAGLERQYDDFLRGQTGFVKYQVDAHGTVLGVTGEQPPFPGATVFLTFEAGTQQVLEESLRSGLELARSLGNPGTRAAGVVLDARDGSVLAMASLPAYRPGLFSARLAGSLPAGDWEAAWSQIQADEALNNLAIQGLYPPGSTFKVVAYATAVEEGIYPEGVDDPDTPMLCAPRLAFDFPDGSQQVFRDWNPNGHGWQDLHGALERSCDVYFWQIALTVWRRYQGTSNESILQEWARRLGFGRETGIDLPFEQAGLVPDRAWFERAQQESPGRVREGPWVGGDLMNIVIGQGALTATPLQVAVAYAALVNGGTVWEPRLVERAVAPDGTTLLASQPEARREVALDPATVASLREDLGRVVSGPGGTARAAFAGFGRLGEVGGKTGTAEAAGKADSAWFVGVAPLPEPRWVVTVVIEEGGSGGQVAAPVARRVLEHLMGEPLSTLVSGAAGSD